MRIRLLAAFLGGCAWILLSAAPGAALEGSYSNHQPGGYGDFYVAVAPEPGFSIASELYLNSASSREVDAFGTTRARARFVQQSLALEYAFVKRVAGARVSSSLAVPLVYQELDLRFDEFAEKTSGSRTSLGDPYIVPISLFWKRGRFHFNLYEGISVPLQSWDERRLNNPGVNYWSFDSKLGLTWLARRATSELSAVVGHTYNTRNDETRYRSGQELHFEFMANHYVSDRAGFGVHGFHQHQITDDRGRGAPPDGFRVRVSGFGPAALWTVRIRDYSFTIVMRWLHEIAARNRPTGENLYLSIYLDL